jgi:hypothetical protein
LELSLAGAICALFPINTFGVVAVNFVSQAGENLNKAEVAERQTRYVQGVVPLRA